MLHLGAKSVGPATVMIAALLASKAAQAAPTCGTLAEFNAAMSASGTSSDDVTLTFDLTGANPADYPNGKGALAHMRNTACSGGAQDAVIKLYGTSTPLNTAHPPGWVDRPRASRRAELRHRRRRQRRHAGRSRLRRQRPRRAPPGLPSSATATTTTAMVAATRVARAAARAARAPAARAAPASRPTSPTKRTRARGALAAARDPRRTPGRRASSAWVRSGRWRSEGVRAPS